jgi:hypothetical protein
MIVVSDTTPLNVKETNFYVTDDVLHESERRYHDRKLAQEQGRKARGSTVPLVEDSEKKEGRAE